MFVLAGSSSELLATKIATQLGATLVERDITTFANGEKRVRIKGNLQSHNVVLVQSLVDPVDQSIMELLLLTDALERMGVRHIAAVIPWLGYSLQDKVFREGEPLSAKVVADLVSNSYIKRVLLQDLHNNSIPGFFSVPTTLLSGLPLFTHYIESTWKANNIVVCSPDFGGLKRARELALQLDVELTNIDKIRDLKTGKVTATAVHGDIEGKTVLIFDDCIVGGGTVIESSKLLKEQGAQEVHFLAAHGLFTGDAQQRIAASPVDSVVITNSIHHPELAPKISQLSVAPLFAQELRRWM